MNITGSGVIVNNIFDGNYSLWLSQSGLSTGNSILDDNIAPSLIANGLNATGVTGILVFFQSGNANIDSGYLQSPTGVISGATANASDLSGYLYYRISQPLIGVCHGVGSDSNCWYSGYNFYNAFCQDGYFAPPFGQNASIYQMNQDGTDALAENGSCSTLTNSEYNDLFGINTQLDPGISASSTSATAFINSPAIACPQDLSVAFYWDEVQYNIIGGTASSVAGNTYYNTNPIPTSLDNFAINTVYRYAFTSSGLPNVPNGDGTTSAQNENIVSYISGRPVPYYTISQQYSIFNVMPTCPGLVAEGSLNGVGTSVESFLLDAPDVDNTDSTSNFDFFNWWNIWHLLYKENSDGFPFSNGQDNNGGNVGIAATSNQPAFGSELFNYTLADSDDYWARRQCPETVNFLPHTFGASIYACPSYYFDIPYYAALNKFGFYGTRFFNGCVSLPFDYAVSGNPAYPDAVEIDTGVTYTSTDGTTDTVLNGDAGINWSFAAYANLLNVAQAEQDSSDFYSLNMALFLWANSGLIAQSSDYNALTGNQSFLVLYNNLFNGLSAVFPSGIYSLLNGQPLFESGAASVLYATGMIYPILSNNDVYMNFKQSLNGILTGAGDNYHWTNIENTYGYVVLQSVGNIDTNFYSGLASAKQQRMSSRYLENYIKGNPIDLYPTNKIAFSYDKAGNFINSINWGKAYGGFGLNHYFADSGLTRSFFLGTYGNGQNVSGLSSFIGEVANINNSSFYPGYFNSNISAELPIPTYEPVVTGTVMGEGYVGNGWLAMGYNGIGKLQGNFSCFTPIFIQQPFNTTYCKIGQSPTFRALAVDYHTIPEDKINIRYPEIVYWTTKLKMVDENYNNLYPLSYQWYRIPISSCIGTFAGNDFRNFLLNPNWGALDPASPTGNWCPLEGNGPVCTLIHPQACIPPYNSYNPAWSYEFINDSNYQTAKQNNFYMTFIKGAEKGIDDQYYYFCMVKGRFGIRISEPSKLFIENWLKFDLSILNGGNVGAAPTVSFQDSTNSYSVNMESSGVENYAGFVNDPYAIPEDVVEEQLPPPNAGWGDVYSYKFLGLWGYRGAGQSYTPGTLYDTRGLIEDWGRMLHYGSLAKYTKTLTQTDGDFLYGRNHLPVCTNYEMASMQDGIRVVINGVVHWANMQYPIVDTDGKYGVEWNQLGNAGELYVPSVEITNAGQVTISPGIGQWQWGNNLGTIHLFGWNSPQSILSQTPYQLSASDFETLKKNLLSDGVLAGDNCGWHKNGLGRNMIYWIEGFSSFYDYCDTLKKKNVVNLNYMSPGLRSTNSSMQYFWLGKPNNTYLERYPLFGPYAYHWKTRPQNRDRNGNGVSQGFYSYGWNQNYSQQYDAPAIYGLSIKYGQSTKDIATMNNARLQVFGPENLQGVKTTRFGVIADSGQEGRAYGDVFLGYLPDNSGITSEYVQSGIYFAQNQEFQLYGCSDSDLKNGDCFDPCLSMRYQFGFLAGGKQQELTTNYPSGHGYRIVANSPVIGNTTQNMTLIDASGTYFRGAFGTPHLQYLTGALFAGGYSLSGVELNGFSPCFDGGADHCNYITPTLNYGSSMYQESQRSSFMSNSVLASASVNL